MISRLAKKIGQAFSPKKVTKATKKVLPKVTTGGLLIGSGIAANKIMQGMEDKPSIVASAAEDSNLIDESYSFNRVEDLTNGLPESYTMGPACISTYVMIALLLIGITYPCYIFYKKIYKCLTKQRESGNGVEATVRNDSVESNLTKERPKFRRVNTLETKWNPAGEEQDVKDSKILATITEQKVKYEKETETAISHRAVSRDERIEELEREIRELNISRMNV